MRAGVPFVLRFTSKFFLEILPAALASVIGGFLFAQYHSSTTPAPPPVAQVTSSIPADRLAAMVEEEHTMLLDYLKRDRAAEKPLSTPQASPAGPAKLRGAVKDSVVKVRRPQPADERTASIAVPTPSPIRVAPPAGPSPVAPASAEAATTGSVAAPTGPARPDDPLTLADRDRAGLADIVPRQPEPASEGMLGSVLSKASAIKNKAINATGDAVTFVVRDIPSRVLPSHDKQPDDAGDASAAPDTPAPAAPQPAQPQRFSETTW